MKDSTRPASRSRSSRPYRPCLAADVLESRRLLSTTPPAPGLSQGPPTVFISGVVIDEGAPGKRIRVESQVTLVGPPPTRAVRITYRTEAVTASGSGKDRDFLPARGVLVIPKGQLSVRYIRTTVVGDNRPEADEVYNIRVVGIKNALLGSDPAGRPVFSRVVIRDDDTPGLVRPTLSVSDTTAVAGDAAEFAFSLSSASAYDVSVTYGTDPFSKYDTARPPQYVGQAGILTIPAGQTSATLPVPTMAGATTSGNLYFRLFIGSPANARLTKFAGLATITPALLV